MNPWRLDPAGHRFQRAGRPEFMLADTVWAAFNRPSRTEWTAWIRRRARQGFNAVNISVLPIGHDRSTSPDTPAPFRDGNPDRPDPAYFARARDLTALAVEAGIVPVLVVLWCNYVPDTWGARLTPDLVLTEAQTDRYLDLVLETFADLGPVFCVSGDERFDQPAANQRYARALRHLRAGAPHCLTTLHSTPDATLPAALAGSDALDYYSFQSGHDTGWDTRAASLPARYRAQPVRRPVVSMEPCYEGHAIGGTVRHTAAAVRQASWTAVLSGAGAGLGYGAHGLWSWHRPGDAFNGTHFSGTPFPAEVALDFPGAWDVGLLRHLVERYDLYDLAPLPEPVDGAVVGTQAGPDRVVAWLPYPFAVTLPRDLTGWRVDAWDLARRRPDRAVLRPVDGGTLIEQPEFLGDALYVCQR